ncbi:MAG: carboxylating nicotinate-nucleotide diphosphorylase [Deltaproteobacteria bacterium]|nr:carboxylating nicotinate-nucleotide diphosphorylase [Deltaproteobacteria bacterium]
MKHQDLVRLVRAALREDRAWDDVTSSTTIPASARAKGVILAKSPLVLAGTAAAAAAFRVMDAKARVVWLVGEGARIEPGTTVATVFGRARALLSAERVAVNFLMRLSGIATLTREFVEALPKGTNAKILDTRKTTPLLRALEKDAVATGGGANHRATLAEAILIKDNHVALAGSVLEAVTRARRMARRGLWVQCEVTSLDEARVAMGAGADALLLDNMSPAAMRKVVREFGGRVPLEASGGVTLATIRAIAKTGVDRISIGALTHSAPAANLSLELAPA